MKTKFDKKSYDRAFSKKYYRENKHTYWKQYYLKNRERILKKGLEYNQTHRAERAEKQRLRRQNKKVRKSKPNFITNSLTIYFD
jgi:hypothetical protein